MVDKSVSISEIIDCNVGRAWGDSWGSEWGGFANPVFNITKQFSEISAPNDLVNRSIVGAFTQVLSDTIGIAEEKEFLGYTGGEFSSVSFSVGKESTQNLGIIENIPTSGKNFFKAISVTLSSIADVSPDKLDIRGPEPDFIVHTSRSSTVASSDDNLAQFTADFIQTLSETVSTSFSLNDLPEVDVIRGGPWKVSMLDSSESVSKRVEPLVSAIEATYDTLSFVFRIERGGREAMKDELSEQSGSVEIVEFSDGSFKKYDTSHDGIGVKIEPSPDSKPPWREEILYAESYDDSRVNEGNEFFDVDLTLGYKSAREGKGNAPNQVKGSDQWEVNFDTGSIVLDSLTSEGVGDKETTSIEATITGNQLIAVLDSLSYQEGVSERTVPGGNDWVVDSSEGSRMTITISPPSQYANTDGFPEGNFVVTDWSATRFAPDEYDLSMEVREEF